MDIFIGHLSDFDPHQLQSHLTTAEKTRSQQMPLERQTQFILSRAFFWQLFSKHYQGDRKKTYITYNPNGKPYLKNHSHPLFFNISHSSELFAIAIASKPIGIDIEPIAYTRDDKRLQRLSARLFDDKTQQQLAKQQGKTLAQNFYQAFTTYEAAIKCFGKSVFARLNTAFYSTQFIYQNHCGAIVQAAKLYSQTPACFYLIKPKIAGFATQPLNIKTYHAYHE